MAEANKQMQQKWQDLTRNAFIHLFIQKNKLFTTGQSLFQMQKTGAVNKQTKLTF